MRAKGFNLLTVPHMAKAEAFYGAGHFSTPEDALEGDAYQVERDNLYLAGTAEIGLINYRSQEVVGEEELPLRYAGISPCYRREAGTYGKETRGLYRVHQFNKVEMVSLVKPADSEKEHEMLLGIAEELLQKLGLSYQVVLNCGGDLGHPQAKKWDIETWLPGMNKYGETHSCSNDTDWQARSLGIRSKNANGERYYVHTLNNTVLASPRILVAILENYQEADGSIRIPDALISYTGFDRIAAA
jgi:seryl-tRNA synthetase